MNRNQLYDPAISEIPPNQMIDAVLVSKITALSLATIDRAITTGEFPAPKRINRVRRWKAQWIFDWCEER